MIDPRTVYLAMPCADGRMMAETTASLLRINGRFAQFSFPSEVSHVSLVRNYIADWFLQSGLDWLVSIDSDIAFDPEDFNLLMEPSSDEWKSWSEAPPTQTSIFEITGRDPESPSKFIRKETLADLLVCAEYSFKNDNLEPVKLGMGFVRIHKSVFAKLMDLEHEDGAKRLWQMTFRGRLIADFFPSGPLLNQLVPTAEWKGEDHGFWTLCHLAGLFPRIERRTRLTHIGRKGYVYQREGSGAQ